jgi:hypothetical protein
MCDATANIRDARISFFYSRKVLDDTCAEFTKFANQEENFTWLRYTLQRYCIRLHMAKGQKGCDTIGRGTAFPQVCESGSRLISSYTA